MTGQELYELWLRSFAECGRTHTTRPDWYKLDRSEQAGWVQLAKKVIVKQL